MFLLLCALSKAVAAKPNAVNKNPKIIVIIAINVPPDENSKVRDSYITTQGWPAQRGD